MNIIQEGSDYYIYGDDVVTKKVLPAQCYTIDVRQFRGFYLSEHDPLKVTETMYGPLIRGDKSGKILRAFKQMDRSLGVLLSGKKGSGKSLFSKLICQRAVNELNAPVIIIDRYIEGMNDFIESIDQELVIFFDEFDKVFGKVKPREGSSDPTTEWLSTFDGTSSKKRLFIVTCNDLYNISAYLVNRPGRFHYHFRFDVPEEQETSEYLEANLKSEYHDQIPAIINFSRRIDLTYDCLRAICFEINNGEHFDTAIRDLNIVNIDSVKYRAVLRLTNGMEFTCRSVELDLYDNTTVCNVYFYDHNREYVCDIDFYGTDGRIDYKSDGIVYTPDVLKIDWGAESEDVKDNRNIPHDVESLTLTRLRQRDLHY